MTTVLFAAAYALPTSAGQPPSAEQYYAHAIELMRHQAVPAFATYRASISGLNCKMDRGGMSCTLGRSTPESEKPFTVMLRQRDGRVVISPEKTPMYLGDSTFINATWPGVDAIIRRGFTGMGGGTPSTPAPVESPSSLPVIAVVSTLSVQDYNVFDGGVTRCANGNAAHSVRLVARREPLRYPLTGATIDEKAGDLCALRFNAKVNGAGGLIGATAGAQLDLRSAEGYYVIANERFSVDLRTVGIAVKHLDVNIAYSDFAFPKAIDPSVFATPSPTPKP